jgi:hypothetical protein
MVTKREIIFLLLGLSLSGCASFAYRYYYLDGVSFTTGKLIGDKPENNLDFSACAPTPKNKYPCACMFTDTLLAWKGDYEKCIAKLKACEDGK